MSTPDFDYERCIVSIWIDGTVNGTGFVIGPGKVLTCAHVVLETDEELGCEKSLKKTIAIEFYGVPRSQNSDDSPAMQPVVIDADHFSPEAEHDIAILTWEGDLPKEVTAARFSFEEKLADRPVRTRGFPVITPYQSQAGTGTIQGTTTHETSGAPHWTLTSQQITGGFSGAPIFDPNSGHVVAMARAVIRPDTHWRNKETAIGIKVQTIMEVCRDLIPQNDTEAERGRKRQESIGKLKALVTEILQADPTRRLILTLNQLPREMAPEAIAEKIFSIDPEYRSPEEYHTPMCFLHRCCETNSILDKDRHAILDHLGRLAAILAPVSFHASESAEIQQMIDKVTQYAQVGSQKPVVGASLVAAYLGLEVDLNHRETVEAAGTLNYDGKVIRSKRKVHASVLLPFHSIDNNGMADAVARGLAPQVGASDPTVQSVRVRLSLLAREKSYICLWFNRALDGTAVKLLKKAFPELIILVSHSQQESLINTVVYEQLQDLQKFIEGK